MGIYLGQLPPAEMARLKAEIAETLIANFSYPRFYDYRTNRLRMRPVDRSKRQEVWTFLSAFDFNMFSRIDVMTPDFQRQVERLLIQYIQRNRAFFGQQGRKRMADVRALITSSSTSVTDGLRGHLNGRATQPPFGNPRPVTTWSRPAISGKPDLSWEQIVNTTMLLQQQLQEVRGEVKQGITSSTSANASVSVNGGGDARPAAPAAYVNSATTNGATSNTAGVPPKRAPRMRPPTQGNGANQTAVPPARPAVPPTTRPIPEEEPRTAFPSPGPLSTRAPAASSIQRIPPVPPIPPVPAALPDAPVFEPFVPTASFDQQGPRAMKADALPIMGSMTLDDKGFFAQNPGASTQVAPPAISPTTQPRELSRTESLSPSLLNRAGSSAAVVSDEDVVIFEQLRYQLILWLRLEAVRAGVEVAAQSPAQLIELLGQLDSNGATRLQVVSTLLNMANQVLANGHATLVEYKQAMMFFLMHTRNTR